MHLEAAAPGPSREHSLGYWPPTDIGLPGREGMLYKWRSLTKNFENSGYDVQAFSPAFGKQASDKYADGSPKWGPGDPDDPDTISGATGRGLNRIFSVELFVRARVGPYVTVRGFSANFGFAPFEFR